MSTPYRPERVPLPGVSLRLSRLDWWRTHGPMNVFIVLMGAAMLSMPLQLLFVRHPARLVVSSLIVMLAGAVTLLSQQRVVRAFVAIVSRRPFVTFSDHGIAIDAGPLDRWSIPWSDLDAFAPDPDHLTRRLRDGDFTYFTLRLGTAPARRVASGVQHSRFREILELSGRFARPSADELANLSAQLRERIRHFEPFLISDM